MYGLKALNEIRSLEYFLFGGLTDSEDREEYIRAREEEARRRPQSEPQEVYHAIFDLETFEIRPVPDSPSSTTEQPQGV